MSLNLDLFCCQNPKCSLFGIRDTGKITVTYKYGKNKDKSMLRCKECTHRFCETKGTVYYRSHKPKEKVDSILRHTQEGVGLRKTSRLEIKICMLAKQLVIICCPSSFKLELYLAL